MRPRWRGGLTGRWRAGAARNSVRNSVVIDALFGAGLDRPVEGDGRRRNRGDQSIRCSCRRGRSAERHSAAIPAPSMGAAVSAAQTVTFFRRKPGHLLLPGRIHCGPYDASPISEFRPRSWPPSGRTSSSTIQPLGDVSFPIPANRRSQIFAWPCGRACPGGFPSTGAARLAARAALRAGAGLVTIASPRSALAVNAAAHACGHGARSARGPKACRTAGRSADQRCGDRDRAAVSVPRCGHKVRVALPAKRTVVLDADALTSFGDNPKELFTILSNHNRIHS